jgi:hypothetical protein
LAGFIEAEDAIVDHHGVESVSDRFVHQLGGDGTVDAPTYGTNNTAFWSTYFTNLCNLLPNEFLHGPIRATPADSAHEPGEDLFPAARVRDFGVELDAVEREGVVCDRGQGRGVCPADDVKIGRDFGELVAVGHPDLYFIAHVA